MSKRSLGIADNRRWLEEQRAARARAAALAARQRQPVDGLYPVTLPSIVDGLNQIDARGLVVDERWPGALRSLRGLRP